MKQGLYYLNNSGSRWIIYPKESVLVIDAKERYCKMRTIEHYEAAGNFAVGCLRYKGKVVKSFPYNCNGRTVFFIDYNDKY